MPSTELTEKDLSDGSIDLISLLVKAELATSRSEGRRAIEQGGVSVNGEKNTDIKATYTETDFTSGDFVIKRGKKKYKKIIFKN